jgi:hypothetical protein
LDLLELGFGFRLRGLLRFLSVSAFCFVCSACSAAFLAAFCLSRDVLELLLYGVLSVGLVGLLALRLLDALAPFVFSDFKRSVSRSMFFRDQSFSLSSLDSRSLSARFCSCSLRSLSMFFVGSGFGLRSGSLPWSGFYLCSGGACHACRRRAYHDCPHPAYYRCHL